MECKKNHDMPYEQIRKHFEDLMKTNNNQLEKLNEQIDKDGYCNEVFAYIVEKYLVNFSVNVLNYFHDVSEIDIAAIYLGIIQKIAQKAGLKIVEFERGDKSSKKYH